MKSCTYSANSNLLNSFNVKIYVNTPFNSDPVIYVARLSQVADAI